MESIIKWVHSILLKTLPEFDLTSLPGKSLGKLRLTPGELLRVIHAQALAEWSLRMADWLWPRRLKHTRAGPPIRYRDSSILLMAVVQTVWRKSYEQIIDFVASNPGLAHQLGFRERRISKGQYWERRQELGGLPFMFFFLGLAAQLVRLGAITGKELMVDSTLMKAWYQDDPGASWQKYAGKKAVFGYKVHAVVCHQADLPVFVLITSAHVHDSQVGWLLILLAAILYSFRVWIVYADAAYFDGRMFKVVHDILHAHPCHPLQPASQWKT